MDAISGIDKDFQNSLSSYGRFAGVFGNAMGSDDTKEMVEKIIFWGTVYGNDKKLLKERIREQYDENEITEEQLKKIIDFKFHDLGKLSRRFLELSGCVPSRIFVEMPREDGEKGKRSDSRKKSCRSFIKVVKRTKEAGERNWIKNFICIICSREGVCTPDNQLI